MARKSERFESQGVIQFDSGLSLPDNYDLIRAKQAANRRKARIGNNPRIKGFLRRSGGLFVPHSGTENAAIVEMPEQKIVMDQRSAVERVYKKYEDSDVPTKNVDLWAHFASNNTRSKARQKYRNFMNESQSNSARIFLALDPITKEITRDRFTYDLDYRIDPEQHVSKNDILAYNSVLKYYVDLEVFTGDNPDLLNVRGNRKWPQIRHNHDYRNRMERAHETLEPLAVDLFAERVDEAYWSHYSRLQFWTNVYNEHERFKRSQKNEYVNPEIPIEAYEKDYPL